jgi:hypothetical protein
VQAYAPLAEHQRIELESLLVSTQGPEATMMKTWFEAKYDEGQTVDRRESLRSVLEVRFGPLSPEHLNRLDRMSYGEMKQCFDQALRVQSLAELGWS